MGLSFRKSHHIPLFVYKTLVLPKTLKQCAYLIEQKQLELNTLKEKIRCFKSQRALLIDDNKDILDINGKLRSSRNALSTIQNHLILLYQWRNDYLNIAEHIEERKRAKKKTESEVKELKLKIHNLEQSFISATSGNQIKRLACQVEQLTIYIATLAFLPTKLLSPTQLLDAQRIARELSGKRPDLGLTETLAPFVEKAKADRLKRKELNQCQTSSTSAAQSEPSY